MRCNTYFAGVILCMSFLHNSLAEPSCPCYSTSDVNRDDQSEFINGERTDGPAGNTILTYQLAFGPTTYYSAVQRGDSYECQAIKGTDGTLHIISREEFESCRDLLVVAPPTTNQVEERFLGQTVVLQNQGTGRFLTANGDGSVTSRPLSSSPRHDASVHGQWIVQEGACPRESNINLSERRCFSLISADFPTTKFGSDGRTAFGVRPIDFINSSLYLIEHEQCTRTVDSCIVRLKLAIYGDRVVADSTAVFRPSNLPLARGADLDEFTSEWVIEVLSV